MMIDVKNHMTNRTRAAAVGIMILAAYTSIASFLTRSVTLIVLLEASAGLEVIAAALLLFPLFLPMSQKLSLSYLICKILEGTALVLSALLLLFRNDASSGIRDMILSRHVYIFIPASMILYILLYRSKLVPRFISLWGGVSLVLLLTGNIMSLLGTTQSMVMMFYPMIILNEFFLAFWLIIKGFNTLETRSKTNGEE